MSYCTKCGRPLQDNEICTCQQPAPAPQQYAAPQQEPAPQQQYAAPQQQYAAPQQQYAAPQQPYGAPQQPYGVPQQQYAAPQQPYGAPQQPYGAPQQPYGAPQQPYGAPQQPYGAPYGVQPKPANTFLNDLINVVVTFFKNPAEAKTLAAKDGKLAIPGVLLGVYAFVTMLVTWLSFNSITLSAWNAAKELAKEYGGSIKDMGMKYGDITKEIFNVPGLLFAGLLTAAVFVGILLLVRFAMGKIVGTTEGDFKSGLVVVSLYSIVPSALQLLACICSFFSFGLCLVLSAVAFVYLLVSMLCETVRINGAKLDTNKWVFIFPAVILVALVVNYLIGVNILKIGLTENMREALDMIGKVFSDPSEFFNEMM